jgi:hypothetical protein
MRRDVHQAMGMVLVQLDTDAAEAFSRLRANSTSLCFPSDRAQRMMDTERSNR